MSVGQIKTSFLPLNFGDILVDHFTKKNSWEEDPLYLRKSSESTKLTAAVNRLDTQVSDTMEVREVSVQVTGDR